MPKHGFRFPAEVIQAVRRHVDVAIRRVPLERFRQEANYTAALAAQLRGNAYTGKCGSVVFESTVLDDRGRGSAEHEFGGDMAITATISDGIRHVRKAILVQAKLGLIDDLDPGERDFLRSQIRKMKRLVDAPKVMEIPEASGQRTPAMISGNRILDDRPYTPMSLSDYFVARVTTTLDGTTDEQVVDIVQDSSLPRAHVIARLLVDK